MQQYWRRAVTRALTHGWPRAAAYLDWAKPSKQTAWGGPMNGQRGRQELTRDIFCSCDVSAIVETGTFRGTTTEFLSHLADVPVYTVELQRRHYEYAKKRFAGSESVYLHLSDSLSFLVRLAADPSVPKEHVFFYLDAHWEAQFPLREELEIIRRHWSDSLVMIDDFQVPGDDGYGYEDYGPARRLTLDYLELPAEARPAVLVPTLPSIRETGSRRGCVLLVNRDREAALCEGAGLRAVTVNEVGLLPS